MVRPLRVGTFGMARPVTSTNESVSPITSSIPSAPRSSTESRCFTRAPSFERCTSLCSWSDLPGRSPELPLLDHLAQLDALVGDVDRLVPAGRQVLADVVRTDGQLAVAAVDHHRQLHRPRAAVGVESVHGGADGAPG